MRLDYRKVGEDGDRVEMGTCWRPRVVSEKLTHYKEAAGGGHAKLMNGR